MDSSKKDYVIQISDIIKLANNGFNNKDKKQVAE